MKKQKILNSVSTILLFILVLTGCNRKGKIKEEESKITYAGSNYVKVAPVERKTIYTYLEYSGTLFSEKSADIAPDLSERIIKYKVQKGDFVEKGNVLAIMDSTQFLQAKAQFESAKKSYIRMLALKENGSIDEQTFDQVEAGYKSAKAGYEFMLANKEIKAPFDGFITAKLKNEGEVFSQMAMGPTGPAILRLVNTESLKLKIQISDKDLPQIQKGQKAIISTDSYPESEFIGKVSFVSQEADMMSGTFTCEISVNNSDNKLKPNQFARVKIILAEEKDALVVPQSAIVKDNTVFIVNNHKAEKRIVSLGIQNENEVQILSGINEREIVITNGNVAIENGTIVEIID
ncbi:MAG: efflux RND transporter periplasmic adaptor subunit [Bacteroidetes bacterium]|nr:MAG: efflux RND transporter periplasmic adaptor subunit [Bacteroidota bacterium]